MRSAMPRIGGRTGRYLACVVGVVGVLESHAAGDGPVGELEDHGQRLGGVCDRGDQRGVGSREADVSDLSPVKASNAQPRPSVNVASAEARAQSRRERVRLDVKWPRTLLVFTQRAAPFADWAFPADLISERERTQRVIVVWAARYRSAEHRAQVQLGLSHETDQLLRGAARERDSVPTVLAGLDHDDGVVGLLSSTTNEHAVPAMQIFQDEVDHLEAVCARSVLHGRSMGNVRFDARELIQLVAADENVSRDDARAMLRDVLGELGGIETTAALNGWAGADSREVYVIPATALERAA